MEELTLDRLCGDWWIYQLRRGHRYATDDLLVAWTGLQARPDAGRVLDLGCGVGSVGLLALHGLSPQATLTGVEAQEVSVGLAARTVAHNGLGERARILHADLRAPDLPLHTYDLILANPPFLPPGTATASPHPQRAAARLELRGDIADYARVAARHLAPGGRFCCCHAITDPRPEAAFAAAGLRLLSRRDVLFRAGRPFGLALYTCGQEGDRKDLPEMEIRDPTGAWTESWRAVRRALNMEL